MATFGAEKQLELTILVDEFDLIIIYE